MPMQDSYCYISLVCDMSCTWGVIGERRKWGVLGERRNSVENADASMVKRMQMNADASMVAKYQQAMDQMPEGHKKLSAQEKAVKDESLAGSRLVICVDFVCVHFGDGLRSVVIRREVKVILKIVYNH